MAKGQQAPFVSGLGRFPGSFAQAHGLYLARGDRGLLRTTRMNRLLGLKIEPAPRQLGISVSPLTWTRASTGINGCGATEANGPGPQLI